MYNKYSDEIIEEVRINNDIVDIISEYVKLEKKGKDYFGLCPFHREKTPSFSVVPGKQIFYCFGCGKGGNVFHFIMNAENLEYIEAVRYLADRAKIQLPEGGAEDEEKARLRQSLLKINTEAARFFYNTLESGKYSKANEYLKNRGITQNTIKKFGLGYHPEGMDVLYRYLKSKGFEDETILTSGLVLSGKKGGYYDRFRGRIIFPIFDIRGNVIAFGGRVTDSSMPKYMNSPETPIYSKGKNLFALNFAKNSGEKQLIIVEGYMDVISLHQSGIINAVASLGTALTESQGRMLKKYSEEVIISYDADTAGQSATMRGLEILNDIGCNVRVLRVPDGKDPDEYIKKKGPDSFRKLVDNASSLFEYKIASYRKEMDISNPQGKINFLNKIAEVLAKSSNRFEIETYARKVANDYEISEEAIISEVYKKVNRKDRIKRTGNITEIKKQDAAEDVNASANIHDERMLLSIICIDNNTYKLVKDGVNAEDFANEESINIYNMIAEKMEKSKGIVPGELLSLLDGSCANEYARIIQNECSFEDNARAVSDLIRNLKRRKNMRQTKEILDLLNNKEGLSEGDVEKLKIEWNQLIMERKKL